MECPRCHSGNTENARFCNQCGFRLKDSPQPEFSKPEHPGTYTPSHLTDKILNTRGSIEGERKLVTVLFADVAGFTHISESLDPEDVHGIMDGCFKILMDEIHKYEGTINQFTGDGVMALFGAPLALEDHAQRACYAALSIRSALKGYDHQIREQFGVAFKMRIGLNSGPVVVGAIGDDLRMDYTAIGDTTNLSARMESLAEPGMIRVSRNTYKLAGAYFQFKSLGKTIVKGKNEPQESFYLTGASHVTSRLDASVVRGLTRYTGRDEELLILTSLFETTRSGSGRIAGIMGEPGAGKSRLIHELQKRIGGNMTWLEGRCLQTGRSTPFLPFKDILRSCFDVVSTDSPREIAEKIEFTLNDLNMADEISVSACRDLLSIPTKCKRWKALTPQERKEKTVSALKQILVTISRGKPMVLAIDDLHWIDKASESFIDPLIQSIETAPILLILLYRPEYHPVWADNYFHSEIALEQLSGNDSLALIRSIAGNVSVSPELCRFIISRAEGNPLFVEELTRSLLTDHTVNKKKAHLLLDLDAVSDRVPQNIQGIIAARMDRLEDEFKEVIQMAAVIGRDFTVPVLEAITGLKGTLDSSLSRLQELEFIYQKSLFPELEYFFKHALTQEVAYNSLLRSKRAQCHEHIAAAMEKIYSHRLDEIYEIVAHHYEKSKNTRKAYTYLKLSAQKALRNYFTWEAWSYLKKALKVLNNLPAGDEHDQKELEILHMMIVPIIALGLPEDSIDYLEQGLRISKKMGDQKGIIRFSGNSGVYYNNHGESKKGIAYIEKAFESAEGIDDLDAMAQTGPDICLAYINLGQYKKVIPIAQRINQAIESQNRQDDFFGGLVNIYSVTQVTTAFCMGMLGRFKGVFDICGKGLATAEHYGGPESMGFCEFLTGAVHLAKGNYEKSRDLLQRGVNHFENSNFYWHLPICLSTLGLAETYLGNPSDGLIRARQALKMNREVGTAWHLSEQIMNLGICHYGLAHYHRAKKAFENALDKSRESHEEHMEAKALICLGRTTWETDPSDADSALRYITKGIKILKALETLPDLGLGYYFTGKILNRNGDKTGALEYLKKAERLFEEMEIVPLLDKTRSEKERTNK